MHSSRMEIQKKYSRWENEKQDWIEKESFLSSFVIEMWGVFVNDVVHWCKRLVSNNDWQEIIETWV